VAKAKIRRIRAMQYVFPPKLKVGDEVRVVAPACSLAIISESVRKVANTRFADLNLKISFGRHVDERDDFYSSSIESRVNDFHAAFMDPNIKAVLTVIGGYNSNQILHYLNWNLVKNNPKIFCGFSDITALNNAILAKTGLVTYSGPHYTTFGQELYFDYTLDYFLQCLFDVSPINVQPSARWSDDRWYIDQKDRTLVDNNGFWCINKGYAEGLIIGGNLCTLNLLQGTEYIPDLAGSILFVEDDSESLAHTFDRDLQSIMHLPSFAGVRGLVIGRFQKASKISRDTLVKIIKTKKELSNLPVIGNVDFGHTDPKFTFPIGGQALLDVGEDKIRLLIQKH
jgi:muramoyltetrapeptide carboxypeptidase